MISDNYVTGDNIYLRELQNFFFEVLGMMSITHYGAVGDGRVDNYGPLQVAIDDAKRRGLSYLYVPYGRFIYTGELINIEGITFMGNPHAHIVNIRTGEEIEIHQFGEAISYVAGDGITINGNLISAIPYTAGDNITIENNVISAEGGTTVTMLTSDLVLGNGLSMDTGFYNAGNYSVYIGSVSPANLIMAQAEMFYFDNDTQTLTTPYASYFYESGQWNIFQNSYIENELTNTRDKIPTSHAVYEYIDTMITQAIGGAY